MQFFILILFLQMRKLRPEDTRNTLFQVRWLGSIKANIQTRWSCSRFCGLNSTLHCKNFLGMERSYDIQESLKEKDGGLIFLRTISKDQCLVFIYIYYHQNSLRKTWNFSLLEGYYPSGTELTRCFADTNSILTTTIAVKTMKRKVNTQFVPNQKLSRWQI